MRLSLRWLFSEQIRQPRMQPIYIISNLLAATLLKVETGKINCSNGFYLTWDMRHIISTCNQYFRYRNISFFFIPNLKIWHAFHTHSTSHFSSASLPYVATGNHTGQHRSEGQRETGQTVRARP